MAITGLHALSTLMTKVTYPLLAAILLLASCNDLKKTDDKTTLGDATADTAVVARTGATVSDVATNAANSVDSAANSVGNSVSNAFDVNKTKMTDVKLPEVSSSSVTVRGNENYQVYGVDEKVLFDTDKAVIKPSAAEALKQISASINKRYPGKDVRVLGFADARGDKAYNRELGKERAESVKNYLTTTDKMAADRLSTESFGETQPVATNATPSGRQENRRVEIAVHIK